MQITPSSPLSLHTISESIGEERKNARVQEGRD